MVFSMKALNVAIFGYGGMAGIHVDKVLKFYDRANVKGIYDIDPARMEAARENGWNTYSSAEELLSDNEVDMVVVATTNDAHKELCIRALESGKHVLCEKPVTVTSKDFLDICEVAKKCGKVFTGMQNRRTNRDFVNVKRAIEAGMLGDVYHIESRVEGSRGLPAGWRTQKEKGGGMMLDWGVHIIDQILYMIDERVSDVYCKMYSVHYDEVDDNFRLMLTFQSGLTALLEVSTNNYISHPRWYVLGSDGTLQIDGWEATGKVVNPVDREDSWGVTIASNKVGPSKTMAPRSEDSIRVTELACPDDVTDDLTVVYDQFIDAVEGKAELTITPAQVLRVIKVMEAAFESARTGNAVKTDI